MGYIKGTKKKGITYGQTQSRQKEDEKQQPYAYTDAEYGSNTDHRRSRMGYIIMLNGGPVEWKSSFQKIVAQSSMESEYIAASEATKTVRWLRNALIEIGTIITTPTKLFIDNKSAITFASDKIINTKSRHIDIRYHSIRERVLKNEIAPVYVATTENIADFLTKPLHYPLLSSLLDETNFKTIEDDDDSNFGESTDRKANTTTTCNVVQH